MKMLKFILSLLATAFMFFGGAHYACADAPVAPKYALGNFPAKAPEAVYKKVEKRYTFRDGKCEFRCISALRVNTLFAVNELCGETFIVYNPRTQHVKINSAYTIAADGVTRVDVPENAFNEVLPAAAANAPAFNFLRELVITHTALEPGAEIFLDYSIFYDSVDGLIFDEFSDMPFPCDELLFNFNGEVMEFRNVPARSRELFYEVKKNVPVIFSGMQASKIRNFDSEPVVLNDAGKKIVGDLISATDKKSGGDKSSKILALQKFIQERIATVRIPSALLNFQVRTPDEVLASAYGTPAEKSLLFKAMLAEVGVPAKIERKNFPEKFILHAGDDKLYIDRDDTVHDFHRALNLDMTLDGQTCVNSIRGMAESRQAFLSDDLVDSVPAEYSITKEQLTRRSELLPASDVSMYSAVVNFAAEQKLEKYRGVIVWKFPVSDKGIASLGLAKMPTTRHSSVTLPIPADGLSESVSVRIQLRGGVELLSKPITINKANEYGEASFRISRDGDYIVAEKRITLKAPVVPAEDYDKLRELLLAWFTPEANRLAFLVGAPAE